MTEVQEKLLEIAKEFACVCEKLGLRYFCFGGTALGAARHKGFIPWDDDMDFVMPREDYEVFIRKAQPLLPEKYFVQCHETEKHFFMPFCKVRDSSTTGIELIAKRVKINQGLWIDIFPMDGIPESIRVRKRLDRLERWFWARRFLAERYTFNASFKTKLLTGFVCLALPTKRLAFWIRQRHSKRYRLCDYDFFWHNWGTREKMAFPFRFFSTYKMMPFEDTFFRVPFWVDEYLAAHYGDWRSLPPESQRTSGHLFAVCDTKTPYTEYLKK